MEGLQLHKQPGQARPSRDAGPSNPMGSVGFCLFGKKVQLKKNETDPYFLQVFQSNTSVCLIISVFSKSCEPICKTEITLVLYRLENHKQKQFHVQRSVYKTRK